MTEPPGPPPAGRPSAGPPAGRPAAGPPAADHPDRARWNERYGGGFAASFGVHPLAAAALEAVPPAGAVLELASGPSGAVLRAAAAGHRVTAVDVSDVALSLLAAEAARRGLTALVTLVHADLATWAPPAAARYALVLATGYWDREVFQRAAAAVTDGGVLAWEAFTAQARRDRPGLPAAWCLADGEPASLLPETFEVLEHADVPGAHGGERRRLLARQRYRGSPGPAGTDGRARPGW